MSIEQQIEVMQHFADGGRIEFIHKQYTGEEN